MCGRLEIDMELSVNASPLFGRYGIEKSIELYRDAGFTAIDFALFSMISDDNIFCGDGWIEEAERIRKTADSLGMKINQTHAPFSFSLPQWNDEDFYNGVAYKRVCRSIMISGILGAKIAVVHPVHHFVYHNHEEEIFEKNMKYYKSLIPICREYNVKVGVENMWQNDPIRKFTTFDVCGTKEEFIRYIDTLDSEYMVACLDVGHVGLPQQDDEAWDFVRALGHDRLQSLHIHDNDYRGDQHLMPYFGKLDWNELTKALGEIDYAGDFTYEVKCLASPTMDDEFVPTALKYMCDVGKHLVAGINAARPNANK